MTTKPVSATDAITNPTLTRVDRLQDSILLLIVLLVGLMAGAASFNHVHDWTLDNSPNGTADWFGWANAVISELIPTASLIEIGRRRRKQASIGYPMVLLIAAVGVSLTAQLAVAEKSPFGWMVSALPALAFFALSKLVFSATAHRPTNPVTAPLPATSHAPSLDNAPAQVSPAAVTPKTRAIPAKKATPAKKTTPARRTPAKKTPAPAAPEATPTAPVELPAPAPVATPGSAAPELLPNARIIAKAHHDEHGEPINAGQLAVRLRVPTAIATDLLTSLHPQPNDRSHNGAPVSISQ